MKIVIPGTVGGLHPARWEKRRVWLLEITGGPQRSQVTVTRVQEERIWVKVPGRPGLLEVVAEQLRPLWSEKNQDLKEESEAMRKLQEQAAKNKAAGKHRPMALVVPPAPVVVTPPVPQAPVVESVTQLPPVTLPCPPVAHHPAQPMGEAVSIVVSATANRGSWEAPLQHWLAAVADEDAAVACVEEAQTMLEETRRKVFDLTFALANVGVTVSRGEKPEAPRAAKKMTKKRAKAAKPSYRLPKVTDALQALYTKLVTRGGWISRKELMKLPGFAGGMLDSARLKLLEKAMRAVGKSQACTSWYKAEASKSPGRSTLYRITITSEPPDWAL